MCVCVCVWNIVVQVIVSIKIYVTVLWKRAYLAPFIKTAFLVDRERAEFKLQNDAYLVTMACSYQELSTISHRPRRVIVLEENAFKH